MWVKFGYLDFFIYLCRVIEKQTKKIKIMKMYEINRWKDSATESLTQNEKSVKKSGVLYFYVTTEQKEYLESHIDEIDEWCESAIGEIPHTIRFEEDWDGLQKSFTCECYFGEEFVVNPNVDTEEGLMDVYHKRGSNLSVSVGAKKYLNGDYSKNGNEVELYTIGSDWKPKFFIRISSKDGSEITDGIIKSHIEIFYSQKEAI